MVTKEKRSICHYCEHCDLGLVNSPKNSVSWKFLDLNQNSVFAKLVCHGAASHGVLLCNLIFRKYKIYMLFHAAIYNNLVKSEILFTPSQKSLVPSVISCFRQTYEFCYKNSSKSLLTVLFSFATPGGEG